MRKLSFFLAIILMIGVLPIAAADTAPAWKEFYVSAAGSDSADGSLEHPFATLERARDAVREISASMQGDIVVNLLAEGGEFILEDTFRLNPEDSGKNGYQVIYRGVKNADGEMPTVSGGTPITGFRPSSVGEGIWEATVTDDDIDVIRDLYVNDNKAVMARTDYRITGLGYYSEPNSIYQTEGMYISKEDIGFFENAEDILFHWDRTWKHSVCKVESIEPDYADDSRVIVKMDPSFWDYTTQRTDAFGASPDHEFWIENALELLDVPGEFYYNRKTRVVYYMPTEDVDMTTAKVFAPKQSRLLQVHGYDVDDRVENITFEGIKFAHAAFNGISYGGFEMGQATAYTINQGQGQYALGGISLNKADNIIFTGNYIFGFGDTGIDLEDAVENITIDGNAISDIGGVSIQVGRNSHQTPYLQNDVAAAPPDPAPSDFNLINGRGLMWTSYYGFCNSEYSSFGYLNQWGRSQYLVPGTETYTRGTWTGDPEAPAKGEQTWLKYEFEDKYTISRVLLAFDPEKVSAEEKTGYEILLSNDFYFREGNYVTAVSQTETPDGNFVDYQIDEPGKYRYIMIRTIGATPFKLSDLWVFTPDVEVHTPAARPMNCVISNNYIRRVGDSQYSSGGIMMYHTKNIRIVHNEITDVPYTGIAAGYTWDTNIMGDLKDNYFGYNKVANTTLALDDGGALYLLGMQEGALIERNWFDNTFLGKTSYYVDNNSSFEVYRENVSTNSAQYMMQYFMEGQGSKGVTEDMFYTDTSRFTHLVGPVLRPAEVILMADPPADARVIMDEAGLEPEYDYLRDLVSDNPIRIFQQDYRIRILGNAEDYGEFEKMQQAIMEVARNIVEKGSFGDLPGQYPIEYRYKLQTAVDNFTSASADNRLFLMQPVRNLSQNATAEFNRVPLAELLETIREELALAEEGSAIYADGAAEKMDKTASAAEKSLANGLSAKDEYNLLRTVEKAYRDFRAQKSSSSPLYVWTEGSLGCAIDEETSTVHLIMPTGFDSSVPYQLEVTGKDAAIAAVNLEAVDLSTTFQLPMYDPITKKYRIWKLVAGAEQSDNQWVTTSTDPYSMVDGDDSIYLAPRFAPHMLRREYVSGETGNITFTLEGHNEAQPITFLFGASAATDVLPCAEDATANRYEIDFDGSKARLYQRTDGTRVLLRELDASLNQDGENTLTFKLDEEGGMTRIWVNINGSAEFNELIQKGNTNGFVGFMCEKTGIRVKK